MWLMMQQDEPDDFVIATGEQHTVREFTERAFAEVGLHLAFRGSGADEVGVLDAVDDARLAKARSGYGPLADCTVAEEELKPGRVLVRVDPRYFRPTEVAALLGDATKAREKLGWQPKVAFEELVREMVWQDVGLARRTGLLTSEGFAVNEPRE
jgi:GDPmannose 4,6-dehydratase